MNDNYENVEWNVHATVDVYTPLAELDDPLSASSFRYASPPNILDSKPISQENPELSTTTTITDGHYYSPSTPPSNTASLTATNKSTDSFTDDINTPQPYTPSNQQFPHKLQHQFQQLDQNGVRPLFLAKPMTIQISDPQKYMDSAQAAFISYLVTTITSIETFASTCPRAVRRRFQDFEWLHNALTIDSPTCIIPPLPEKHRLEYIKGDRFGSDFVERRRVGLQWFMDRISRHPELQQSLYTRIFLESGDFKNDKRTHHILPTTSIFEPLSDILINPLPKIKKPDDRFVQMKDVIDKLEENLSTIERMYSRVGKRQYDLQQDYSNFSASIQSYSVLETSVASQLNDFSDAVQTYAKVMSEMTYGEDLLFLNNIHELLAYCNSAKATLRARDKSQMHFDEMAAYLHRTIQERERTLRPGRNLNGALNITEIVTDKINEARGINTQQTHRGKLAYLERKIKELEWQVARANDGTNGFSTQVIKEYEVFERAKNEELKQGLAAYADSHIKFFEKGVSVWGNILPILESINVDDGDDDDDDDDHDKGEGDGEELE